MARLNLVEDPSFRNGTSSWLPVAGATIAPSDNIAFYGTWALRVTKVATAGSGVVSKDPFSVTAGLPYSISAYVAVQQTLPAMETADLAMKITWYNSSDLVVSENTTTTINVPPTSTWQRLTGVYFAPVTAVKAKVTIFEASGSTAGDSFDVDAVLVEQSNYVGGFLDNLSQSEEDQIVNTALSPRAAPTVGGMQLNADVSLGDLVLNTVDEDNTLWVCTDMDGWWGHASPEMPDIPRGVEDGSYDVTGRYQARIINLTGVFIPASTAQLGVARNRLIAAANLVRKGAWLRTNENPTRAAFVRLSGQPRISTVNSRGRTEFSIGLKAADPVKYQWNDADPDGLTTIVINGLGGIGEVPNDGNAEVTGVFELTGPLGNGTTIYNVQTDETITLVQALRGANAVATVVKSELFEEIATLTTSAPHNLVEGDVINVTGVGAPYDSVNETFEVLAATNILPYTVSYYRQAIDRPAATVAGSVGLSTNDILEINTYDRSVKFNGRIVGNRARIETLVDWIKFAPGDNTVVLNDSIDELTILSKQMINGDALLTTDKAHFLSTGDSVTVSLPQVAALKRKSLTANIATLTTAENHGFSIGDKVDVSSTTISDVNNKVLTSNVATLTTVADGGFVSGDSITVALPVTRSIVTKSVTTNIVTLSTPVPHGYSVGDAVTVELPVSATPTGKALLSNAATITASGGHGFSIGDSVTVTLPVTANVTNKLISGSSVTLTTSSAHGFVVADMITVALPSSASIVGLRTMAGAPTYYATITTLAAHGFAVGDKVTVALGVSANATVTNRASAGTTRTLTVSATHGFAVGEAITVSGVLATYNGNFRISAVSSNTISYVAGSALTESTTAATGSVVDTTISTGYNGTKIIETVPSATTFTYLAYNETSALSGSAVGSGSTVVNVTNTGLNGTFPIAATPTTTQLQYNKA